MEDGDRQYHGPSNTDAYATKRELLHTWKAEAEVGEGQLTQGLRPGWGAVVSQGTEQQGRVEVSQCSLTHKACSPQTGPACPSVL